MERLHDNIYRFSAGADNAYLIKGDTNILVDGVCAEFAADYIKAVSNVVSFEDIRYIVINHAEPNRSGTLEAVLKENPDITVIASTAGLKLLSELTELKFNSHLAKDGMEMQVNGVLMKFILAPYINWPCSMLTLYGTNLFSSDAFSDAENGMIDWYTVSHADSLKGAVETLRGHKIEHVLRGTGKTISGEEFKKLKTADIDFSGVLILYSSLYGATEEMAKTVYGVFEGHKTNVSMYNIKDLESREAAEKINRAAAVVFAVNTINGDAPSKMWEIIGNSAKLINKNKPCMLLGTYGWGGEGLYYLEKHLRLLRYDIYEKPFSTVLRMKETDKDALIAYTRGFLAALDEKNINIR